MRNNEKVCRLFAVAGFSVTRIKPLPNGDRRRMHAGVVFYRDLETGKMLQNRHNRNTNEGVRVVPTGNDPLNSTISVTVQLPPSYGGLKTEKRLPKPFLLGRSDGPQGKLICRTGIDMISPGALQPDKWPRGSAGPMSRVSKHFIYTIRRNDVENSGLTNLPIVGAWSRITPWFPWMLMGQAPGNISYFTSFSWVKSIAELPADLVVAARAISPKYLSSPTEKYRPSLLSLENYAKTERPAPVPPGWSAPQPPSLKMR